MLKKLWRERVDNRWLQQQWILVAHEVPKKICMLFGFSSSGIFNRPPSLVGDLTNGLGMQCPRACHALGVFQIPSRLRDERRSSRKTRITYIQCIGMYNCQLHINYAGIFNKKSLISNFLKKQNRRISANAVEFVQNTTPLDFFGC